MEYIKLGIKGKKPIDDVITSLDNVGAGGAGGVPLEPGVDASHVEGVTALPELPDLLALGELEEADGAVGRGETWIHVGGGRALLLH